MLCCRIHLCCLFNICKEILCVHLAACVEKKSSLIHAHRCIRELTVHRLQIDTTCCKMTYAVCHLLASKDRCEPPCLSLSDWWLVSLPSVSTMSQLLVPAIAILRKWQRVTCHETWADRWTPSLTLPSATPLYPPGSHSSLGLAPVCPEPLEWGEFGGYHSGSVGSLRCCCQKYFTVAWAKLDKTGRSTIHEFMETKWVFKVCEGRIVTE